MNTTMLKPKKTMWSREPRADTEAVLICPDCGARRYVGEEFLALQGLLNAQPGCVALPGCVACGSMMVMEVYPGAAICAPVVD